MEMHPEDDSRMAVAGAVAERGPRIDHMRKLARIAHQTKDGQQLISVWGAFDQWARDLLAFMPADADLPGWQEMALDFETALRGVDQDRSAAARLLAAELRTAIAMIERNPSDQVARKSTAQRLLKALATLGGARCRLVDVRERSGLGATHLSNILKPLVAHGFVAITPDRTDSRNKLLSLTARGIGAVGGSEGGTPEKYRDHLARDPRRGAEFRHAGGVARRRSAPTTHAQPRFRRNLESI